MKLARFAIDDTDRCGVVLGDRVLDLTLAAPDLPAAMPDLVGHLAAVRAAAERATTDEQHRLTDVTLLAPIARPPKFLAIGLNYADHIAEGGREAPTEQLWFNKQSTCVVGPGEAIEVPRASPVVDYEGELGVVIGTRCRHVSAAEAREVVAGYCIVNDVSVRDWQRRSPTMTMGKSFDTHGPIGPWIVTDDEIDDPQDLWLTTTVNGEVLQDASTGNMIFGIGEQIAHLTTAFTLEPGDVIATGTPAGVGIFREPPVLLKAGDTVRIEISGIGVLENPVIDEPRA